MGIGRIIEWHQVVQPVLEIMAGIGIGIFLDQQAGRGMLDEYRAQTGVDGGLINGLVYLSGYLMQPLSLSCDGQLLDHVIIVTLY